jgi:hypothetical protein
MKYKSKKIVRKNRKTKKRQMRGGGFFTEMSLGIPGVGSVGRCKDKPIWNWKTKQNDIQKCYMIYGNKIYKTVQSDGAANDS